MAFRVRGSVRLARILIFAWCIAATGDVAHDGTPAAAASPRASTEVGALPPHVRWILPRRTVDVNPGRESPAPARDSRGLGAEYVSHLPLAFAAVGRPDAPSHFVARTPGYSVRIAATTLDLRPAGAGAGVTLSLRGGSASARADAAWTGARLTHVSPSSARQDELASRVVFRGVYPGVDVAYYGTGRMVEHDFVVAPHGALDQIAIEISGRDRPQLTDAGNIRLGTDDDGLELVAPVAYQLLGTTRRPVASRYRLDGAVVRFVVDDYDPALPLVIDPVVSYTLALGGSRFDEGSAIAVDADGNVIVAGPTLSADFPDGAHAAAEADVFVMKVNAAGTALLGSIVIGGSRDDEPRALRVDDTGAVYVAGLTWSPDFPTVQAYRAAPAGHADGFVAKLDPALTSIVFATYLGGSRHDEVTALAVDGAHDVFVAGTTASPDFPVASPIRAALSGPLDAFVTRLAGSGQLLRYSTYIGGAGIDTAQALAVSPNGDAIMVGSTRSDDYPTVAAAQATRAGDVDAVVTALTGAGALRFSTHHGGSMGDMGQGVAVDASGRIFVSGTTASADLGASTGQVSHGGALDAFIAAYSASGARQASSYMGGSGRDRARGLAVDAAGYVYVTGQTSSLDFPVVRATQAARGGGRDAFMAMLDPSTLAAVYATYVGGAADDDAQAIVVDHAGRACITGALGFADSAARGGSDVFVVRMSNGAVNADTDNDNLPDDWEVQFGLDPLSNDASSDPDGDGLTNAQEFAAGTHPRGFVARYLAEGATSVFFDTRFAILNPTDAPAAVLLRAMKTDGSVSSFAVTVPAQTRSTVDAKAVSGLATAEFSTAVESDALVVVDRQMTWDATGYGSHAETATERPATTWYLAEGATHSGLELFYLIQNPSDAAADLTVTYLLPAPRAPLTRTYTVAPRSRQTIWVDREHPSLAATDVSAIIESTNGVGVLVERSMYLNSGGRTFGSGHASSAVTRPSASWFLAEGATGAYFDLFVLIANPATATASVRATYLLPDGSSVVKTYDVAGRSRQTIWVDLEDARLASTAVSTVIESLNGVEVIVERALWWPGPTSRNWLEAHNSAGSTTTGTKWGLAEGEQGGVRKNETYILIANTSPFAGEVDVTLYFEDDGSQVTRRFAIAANSRFNVQVAYEFPQALGRRFGAVVTSVGSPAAQIVVERAMYSSTTSTTWAAGTNALATLLSADVTVTLTAGGLSPRSLSVPLGARLRVVNADTRAHWFASNPHPDHTDCPELDQVGFLEPGAVRESGNLTRAVTCGVHDHLDDQNPLWHGTLTVR